MTVVLDASVALKWFVPEPDSALAEDIFANARRIVAPQLVIAEVCNASWRLLRKGEVSVERHTRIAAEVAVMFNHLEPLPPLVRRAAALAVQLNHPLYDCFYLAFSELLDAPLVTADKRFAKRTSGTAFERHIILLSDRQLWQSAL